MFENMQLITGEHPCRSVILINLRSNFFKIILRQGSSSINLLYFQNTFFWKDLLKTTSGTIFLVDSNKIGNTTFPYKTVLSVVSFKTNGMESIKWTYHKEITPSCFSKFIFSIWISYEELVWCINYPNVHIHAFREHWNFIWRCIFP